MWRGTILRADGHSQITRFKVADPAVSGWFDDQAASLTLDGFFFMSAAGPRTSRLAGAITIDFLGRIDAERSDELLSGDQPEWKPIIGFSRGTVGPKDAESKGYISEPMSFCGYILGFILIMQVLYL